MGIFKVIRNTNDGLQYMYNALNYVCYEHTDYDKRYSPNVDIDNAYEQFLLVKRYFYKTSGNPIFHLYAFLDHIKHITKDFSWHVEFGSDK